MTKPPSRFANNKVTNQALRRSGGPMPLQPPPLNQTPLQQTVIYHERRGNAQIFRLTTTPATPQNQASIRAQLQRRDRGWRLVLFWVIMLICVLGSFAIGGIWLVQRRPERSCQSMPPVSSTRERLYCQELAAEAGDLDAGFAILAEVSQWPTTHPLYTEQRQLLEDWSQWAFNHAQGVLAQGDLNQALLTARRIPPNSPLAATASTAMTTWQEQWQQAEQLEAEFEQAIATQQWQTALGITYQLAQSPLLYWRTERSDALLKRLRYTRIQYPQAAPNSGTE